MVSPSQSDVERIAKSIARSGRSEKGRLFNSGWWNDRLMGWALNRPDFKTQLFRFVDVFPALGGHSDVLAHLEEYFEDAEVPRLVDVGIGVADKVPFGDSITASVAEHNIMRMAKQFIVGSNADEAVTNLHRLWNAGRGFTVDLLGEKTVTDAEADRYCDNVCNLLRDIADSSSSWEFNELLESDDEGEIPRVNVSIKPTALATHYAPLTSQDGVLSAQRRLEKILDLAKVCNAHVHFDAEHYDVKDITQRLFEKVATDPRYENLSIGIVIQAYLRDSFGDLERVIEMSSHRKTPIVVRLVKGAYWDSETISSRANGWESPCYSRKQETDANYERCAQLLLENHGSIKSAFASHNLRTLAYVIASSEVRDLPQNSYELQLLYGMAEPVHAGLAALGYRVRVYSPVGDLVPGMAYLVRRLLENTSNESFVRARFTEQRSLDKLLVAPTVSSLPERLPARSKSLTEVDAPSPYAPEPLREWRRLEVRLQVESAVESWKKLNPKPQTVNALVGGKEVSTFELIESVDPSDPTNVVARSAACDEQIAKSAVDQLATAQQSWSRRATKDRAEVLFRTAHWFRQRRNELIALEIYEAGRPRAEADAEICEAIDFCEYYGREALRLHNGGVVQSPPGEKNTLRYFPKGIVAVIAPWNFPLAIPTGMVTAALVTGNVVAFKPAEQTPLIAKQLVLGLVESGLPPEALAFLPGLGESVGSALVQDSRVNTIVFTGSASVGLEIVEHAGMRTDNQTHVTQVIAEMGGKNAVIVDGDADLDLAVPAIAHSAFGFSGQKCSAASRVYVMQSNFEEFVSRFSSYAQTMIIDKPEAERCEIGPLIEASAQKRLREAAKLAAQTGRVLVDRSSESPRECESGYFVGPVVVTDLPDQSELLTRELFGPLVCVVKVKDFDEAIEMANTGPYALTAGVFTRSPRHIDAASRDLRAGNLYINRSITGAVVGRQPFGGFGLSGVGSKAGGPDYLLQFCNPRVVSENLVRQGFAPDLF